jgi:O-antigen/teichoic acid export membrane protein
VSEQEADRLGEGHGPTRNTFNSLLQQGLSAFFTAALTLFLVRELGPKDYGVLALATSIGTIVLLISDFGISTSAARFVAEDSRNRSHAAAVFRSAVGMKAVVATITTILLIVLAPTLASWLETPALTLPIRLMAISAAAQGFGSLFISMFAAFQRVSLGFSYTFVESSVEAISSVALVLFGAGAAGAVAGRAIGFAAAGILAAVVTVRLIGRPAIQAAKGNEFPRRKIVGYGFSLMVIDGAFAIFDRVDVLIIGAMISSTAAGLFEAPLRLLALVKYPAMAIAAGYTPRLAGARREQAEVLRFLNALRMALLFYLFLAAPILVWAEPIVHLLLGSSYAGSVAVLRVSTPTVIFSGLTPILAAAANYLGEAHKRVPLALGALGINIVIDVILVPKIGIVAGAIGTATAFTIYAAGHIWICQHALHQSFAPLLPSLGRGLLGGAAVALILLALGTDEIGIGAWVVGVILAPIAYLAVLVATRELSKGEVRWVYRRVRGAMGHG